MFRLCLCTFSDQCLNVFEIPAKKNSGGFCIHDQKVVCTNKKNELNLLAGGQCCSIYKVRDGSENTNDSLKYKKGLNVAVSRIQGEGLACDQYTLPAPGLGYNQQSPCATMARAELNKLRIGDISRCDGADYIHAPAQVLYLGWGTWQIRRGWPIESRQRFYFCPLVQPIKSRQKVLMVTFLIKGV